MKKEFKIDFVIYSKNVLKEAITDFEEVANIQLNNNGLEIEGNSYNEIEEIFNELMNYIISLEN